MLKVGDTVRYTQRLTLPDDKTWLERGDVGFVVHTDGFSVRVKWLRVSQTHPHMPRFLEKVHD